MSLIEHALPAAERIPWPDALTRAGVRFLVSKTSRKLAREPQNVGAFAQQMAEFPIAAHTADANDQHYEVPAAFFDLMLGPRRKYSCCYYETSNSTLAEAEECALRKTASNADLRDGMDILELGCGWGSLSLWMAEQYPSSRITAVSNSNSQRAYIMRQAEARRLANLSVITCDMNSFQADKTFDRVVSIEMFEHMSNWRELLARVRTWIKPGGHLFLHVFTHRAAPYRFDHRDKSDWIAQHFFTGGIMPCHDLAQNFPDLFAVDAEWRWNGTHYARTARDWLANMDRNEQACDQLLRDVYGKDAKLWHRRWRLFLLATEGLFGYRDGSEWGVSHYRMSPR